MVLPSVFTKRDSLGVFIYFAEVYIDRPCENSCSDAVWNRHSFLVEAWMGYLETAEFVYFMNSCVDSNSLSCSVYRCHIDNAIFAEVVRSYKHKTADITEKIFRPIKWTWKYALILKFRFSRLVFCSNKMRHETILGIWGIVLDVCRILPCVCHIKKVWWNLARG